MRKKMRCSVWIGEGRWKWERGCAKCVLTQVKSWRCTTWTWTDKILIKQRKTNSIHFPYMVVSISDRSWQSLLWGTNPPTPSTSQHSSSSPWCRLSPLQWAPSTSNDNWVANTNHSASVEGGAETEDMIFTNLWRHGHGAYSVPENGPAETERCGGPRKHHQSDWQGDGSSGAEGEWLCHPTAERVEV